MKCMKRIATEEFKEEDHPRDSDGKFVKKGGGSSYTKDNFDEFIKKLDDIKYEKNDDVIRYIKHNLNEIEKYGKPTDLEKENIIVDKMEADWLESLNLDRGDIFEKFRIENPTKKDEWGNWVDFDENSYIESMPEDLKKMYKDVKSKKEHEIEYSKKNNKWTPYYEPFSDYPFLYPKLSEYQKDELASEQWDSYDFEEKQDVYDYFFKKELEEDIDYADLDYYEKQEIRNDWSKYGDLTDSYLTKEKEWYYQDKEYKKLYDEYSKLGVSYGDYNESGIESNFWNYYKGVPEKQSIETIDNWRFKIMFADDNQELVEYKIPKYPIVDKLSVEEHNNTIKELRDKTPNIKKEISNDFKNIIDYAEKKEDLQFELHSVSIFAKQMGREKSDLKELFLNEIRTGNITVSDYVSNYEKSKQLEFFSDMITSNEDIEKMYNDLTKKMDKINHENYDLFLKSPEFYRGTTTEELDSFIKDETFKSGKYDFKSLSMDRKQATGNSINSNADGFRCVIVFEGDGVRDVGIPIQYNPVPVEPNFTFGDKSERIDTPLPMVFLEEREVRIPIGKKIPKIKELNFGDSLSEEQKKEIMEKYSSLTDNIKFEKFRADEHYVIKSIDSEGLKCMKKATEEFKEEDHPRDEDGKFTDKTISNVKNEKNVRVSMNKSILQGQIDFLKGSFKEESKKYKPFEAVSEEDRKIRNHNKSLQIQIKSLEEEMNIPDLEGLPMIKEKPNTHKIKDFKDGFTHVDINGKKTSSNIEGFKSNNTDITIYFKDDYRFKLEDVNVQIETIRLVWNELSDEVRDMVKQLKIDDGSNMKDTSLAGSWLPYKNFVGKPNIDGGVLTIKIGEYKTIDGIKATLTHEIGHVKYCELLDTNPEKVKEWENFAKNKTPPTSYSKYHRDIWKNKIKRLEEEKNLGFKVEHNIDAYPHAYIVMTVEEREKLLTTNAEIREKMYYNELHSEVHMYMIGHRHTKIKSKTGKITNTMEKFAKAYKDLHDL